jgi:curved DNA-binding protein CbpA
LFQEFKTAKGEVLDPYKVLKVKQTASIDDVKQAYRQLSRKYHADANRFKDVLPGRW